MTILQRYVLFEFLKTFLLALVVLTLVFFMGTMLQIVRKFAVLEPAFLLLVLPHMFLSAFTFTFPFSVLVGCTLTFSRIAHDNELTAMRAGGVHLHHIIWPVCVAALLFSGFAFYMAADVVPRAYNAKRKLASRAIKLFFTTLVGTEPGTIPYFPGYRIYFSGYQNNRFQNLVIHRISKNQLTQEIMAKEGELRLDEKNLRAELVLSYGSISHIRYKTDAVKFAAGSRKKMSTAMMIRRKTGAETQQARWIGFDSYTVDLQIPSKTRDRPVENPKGRTLLELRAGIISHGKRVAKARSEIPHYENELKLAQARLAQAKGPQVEEVKKRIDWCGHRIGDRLLVIKVFGRGHRQYRTNLQGRFALSLACLVVSLLGIPLGILVRHSNKLVSFAIAAIPVVGLYYPLMMAGEAMGESGALHPGIGMWMGNVVVGAIGVGLLLVLYRR